MSAHTPGPWQATHQKGGICGPHTDIRGAGETFVAHLYEVGDADARLIAAAPRMYQTLETIAGMTFDDPKQGLALIQAMAKTVLKEADNG